MKGLWTLLNSNPPLYTNKAADIIKHKGTSKEYIRGTRKLFNDTNMPSVVEDTNEYEFIYLKTRNRSTLSAEEVAKEILVTNRLK